jgi:hypothetical protein
MPTPYGAIILRIQVDNTADVETVVQKIQPKFTLKTVEPVYHYPYAIPPLTKSLLTEGFSGNATEQLLQLTARLAPYNPPEVEQDVTSVNSTLELAGMRDGNYTQPDGVDLEAANITAHDLVMCAGQNSTNFVDLGYNWTQLAANKSGDFRSDYVVRSLVTEQGYLQLTADQAVYPAYAKGSPLLANQTYLVTFFEKPHVNGFWSLTAYNESLFLVDNRLNRYSLGDRSALHYQDGSLVYGGDGSLGDSDELTFEILMQSTDVIPPSNYCSK